MIKEAINRILELDKPNITECASGMYVDKKMYRIDQQVRAEPLKVSTLSSLLTYIAEMGHEFRLKDCMLHIVSHKRVELISSLDGDRRRETFMIAEAETPRIPFGEYIDHEAMLITVQSMFIDNPETDRAAVLKFAGTVTSGTIKDYNDDGVTQKATIRQGVASKVEAIVPSPCRLQPFRTFIEVDQPVSEFIFRMREGRNEPEAALFEADGGAWKVTAKQNIFDYLSKSVNVNDNITIIS